ncbi:MAG: thioesterase family protein [Hyphomicrobiaceae bacterium]|nr:thioesterase family protein [Hyphomicrobiaceae bacterium]
MQSVQGEWMKATLQPGVRAVHTFTVSSAKTVPSLYPEAPEFLAMPAVFATGFHVGLMEWAAILALAPHLDDGEGSLGVHIDVSHTAATLPGQTITVEAEVTAVDGRRISYRVKAHDGIDTIGEGTHQRMVVPWDRFRAKVNQKAHAAGVAPLGHE